MKRRFVTAAIFCLVALVAALPSSAASRGPRITEAGGSVFPGRAYIISLPHGRQLAPGAVSIFENGQPVTGLTVTPVGASKKQQFAAVLVIDASMSMQGAPERTAFSAARAFAGERPT